MRRKKFPIKTVTALVLIVILAVLWDWNWFKPLVEARASAATGRKVTIGHFDLWLFHGPTVVLDNVAVENPPNFDQNEMATVKHVEVSFEFMPLFKGDIVLPNITLVEPRGEFRRLASGDANWTFKPAEPPKQPAKPASMPNIGSLTISDGLVRYVDPKLKSDFTVKIHTEARQGSESRIVAVTKGSYSGKPITSTFIGGNVLNLRDKSRPYPVDFTAANGATEVSLKGTIQDPVAFGGANLVLNFKGNDLADLYPLTNIPFPATPAYHLTGNLDYADRKFRFKNIEGVVGSSDLEGTISEDPGLERPLITADLRSKKVLLADLAGFIGSTPGKPGTANFTAKQEAERSQQEANPKLLPDKPINLPKLRSADLDITYNGERIESSTPLDNLSAHLYVKDGALTLRPLNFGVGGGTIASDIALNGQQDLVHAVANIDFRRIDVSRIMQSTGVFKGVGTIGGRANIDATGNSLAQMMGRGNGGLVLAMKGGDISAILVDLAGLDFGNTLLSALGLPNRAPVRCMVSSFDLKQGLLDTNLLIIDTTEANIVGKGHVDLRGSESIDYVLTTEPKHFSVGSLSAPIDVKGALKSPHILPDPATVAAKGGAAALLGVLLTPLGALIPTIQLGLGQDNDCHLLVERANAEVAKMKAHPTALRTPARASGHLSE